MKYAIATISRVGNRKSNQDRYAVVENTKAVLMILADGMSGHADGKLAADTLIQSVVNSFNNTEFPHGDPQTFLQQIIAIANHEVLAAGAKQTPPTEPRTTCVLCLVQQGHAWWAHVGDSRLYWIRNGEILQRTLDHSRVEDLYQKGEINAQQRSTHPERSVVTQCIGSSVRKPNPTISEKTALQTEDVLLLCSDGLWGPLPKSQLAEGFQNQAVDSALDSLAATAESISFPRSDNVSGVVLRWQPKQQQIPTNVEPINAVEQKKSSPLKAVATIVKAINNKA